MNTSRGHVRAGLAVLAVVALLGDGAAEARTPGSVRDTVPNVVDTLPGSHAALLDSLRQRAAELRADIHRLRIRFGVRVERIASGLRFRIPARGVEKGEAPLRKVASLVRRHYPGARVGVLAAEGDRTGRCGSPAGRRRTRAVIDVLTGPSGLEAGRVHRADCDRDGPSDSPVYEGGANRAGVSLFVEWPGIPASDTS